MSSIWTPVPFEADDGTVPFEKFVSGLTDFNFVVIRPPSRAAQRRFSYGSSFTSTATAVIPVLDGEGLTDHGEFPMLVAGGNEVDRSYQDIVAERRERLAPESAAAGEVFARAYDIAMQIIELRESRGLTQSELAERCGIDQGDISRIERGSTSPTARTLQRIAEALDSDLRLISRA